MIYFQSSWANVALPISTIWVQGTSEGAKIELYCDCSYCTNFKMNSNAWKRFDLVAAQRAQCIGATVW